MIAPGRPVLMTQNEAAKMSKTTHSLQLTYEVREGESADALVGCNPHTAERIAEQVIEKRCAGHEEQCMTADSCSTWTSVVAAQHICFVVLHARNMPA
jgi:hypothetical protein